MSKGWIKAHRELTDHFIWRGEKFSRGQAWIDLLLHSNYCAGEILIKGQVVKYCRGDQVRSEMTLSQHWNWSREKVRRYLKLLEKHSMISQKKTHLTSIITICNYERYQTDETSDETSDETCNDTPDETCDDTCKTHVTSTKRYTVKKVISKEGKKGKNTDISSHDSKKSKIPNDYRFDEFWKSYPKKTGRKACLKIWENKILVSLKKHTIPIDEQINQIIDDVINRDNHFKSWQDGFIHSPSTYLNQELWKDEWEEFNNREIQNGQNQDGQRPSTAFHQSQEIYNKLIRDYQESSEQLKRETENGSIDESNDLSGLPY